VPANAIIHELGIGEVLEKTIPVMLTYPLPALPLPFPKVRQSQNQSTAIGPMDCEGSNGAYHTDRRSLRILPIIGVSLELKRPSRCSSM
jgi:hypothetical protein